MYYTSLVFQWKMLLRMNASVSSGMLAQCLGPEIPLKILLESNCISL